MLAYGINVMLVVYLYLGKIPCVALPPLILHLLASDRPEGLTEADIAIMRKYSKMPKVTV